MISSQYDNGYLSFLQNIPFWLHNVPGTVIDEKMLYTTDMYQIHKDAYGRYGMQQ